MVNSEHYPVEQGAVQRFSHGVSYGHSLKEEKKGDWKQFLLCTKTCFASQASMSNVHTSPLPKLLSTILIYAMYANGPDAIGSWSHSQGHEMCPLTLAWFPLVHSSS